MFPKISIVTPTYNQGDYIEETIQSVLDQNYPNLEYIIMDGGSTDNTVEIIKKYEKHITYWESKPDKGQAHAINKGLSKCTGLIFNWLNSDDYLAPGALHAIAKAFENSDADAVAGQTIYFDENEEQEPEQLSNLTPEGLIFWKEGTVFVQPGLWLLREKINQADGLDENLHFSFDTDMIIRYLSLFPTVKYIKNRLVYFRLHDKSKTVSQPNKFIENKRIYLENIINNLKFEKIHKLCSKWLIMDKWSNLLKVNIESDLSKITRIKNIITPLFSDSSHKLNRKTLGAIKKIFLS